MTVEEWIEAFAREAGVAPPTTSEIDALLALAGVAARSSERRAAPITTWLAARSSLSPAGALEVAERLSAG